MKICFIQSSEEIKLIKEKISDIPIVVPLSLEALSFCDLMNIKFIDIKKMLIFPHFLSFPKKKRNVGPHKILQKENEKCVGLLKKG